MYLKNVWYQAGWSNEVTADEPLIRTIAEQPILFWRDGDGVVRALLDMCPHRFAPLSMGRIGPNRVICGYHGLAFGTDGRCVHNPHGATSRALSVRAFPVIERHGAMWTWLGDPAAADPALLPDLSFIDDVPEHIQITGYMPTAAEYRLIADNILDLSHADYLHPTSLGGIMTGAKSRVWETGNVVHVRWEASDVEPIPVARAQIPLGQNADFWMQVDWHAPGLLRLGTATWPHGTEATSEHEAWTLHNMVPETASTTHYFFCSVRGFGHDDPDLSARLRASLLHAFNNEDKPMLEAQQRRIGNRDFSSLRPRMLGIDKGAVAARRKLDDLLAKETRESC